MPCVCAFITLVSRVNNERIFGGSELLPGNLTELDLIIRWKNGLDLFISFLKFCWVEKEASKKTLR